MCTLPCRQFCCPRALLLDHPGQDVSSLDKLFFFFFFFHDFSFFFFQIFLFELKLR